MQVYEKIMTDSMTDGELSTNYKDKESTRNSLCANKLLPCEINSEMNYISAQAIYELCNECELDCNECLDKYLDHELQDERRAIT